jgi:hypothetical protein
LCVNLGRDRRGFAYLKIGNSSCDKNNCLYFYKFNRNIIYPKTLAEIGRELFRKKIIEPFIETLHDSGIILDEVSFDIC